MTSCLPRSFIGLTTALMIILFCCSTGAEAFILAAYSCSDSLCSSCPERYTIPEQVCTKTLNMPGYWMKPTGCGANEIRATVFSDANCSNVVVSAVMHRKSCELLTGPSSDDPVVFYLVDCENETVEPNGGASYRECNSLAASLISCLALLISLL